MKKRLHNSRKGRALLYALLLAAVILVSSAVGFYRFLPRQAILDRAETQGIEKLKSVLWVKGEDPSGGGKAWFTLSVGERTLFFCPVMFRLQNGWQTGTYEIVETWRGEGFYFGVWQYEGSAVTYLFGREDGPTTGALTVCAEAENGTIWSQELTPNWIEKEGNHYFIAELKGAPRNGDYSVTLENGKTVKDGKIFHWW